MKVMNPGHNESFEITEGFMVFIDVLGYRNFIKENAPNHKDSKEIHREKKDKLNHCIFGFYEQFKHHGIFWNDQYRKYSEKNVNSSAISYSDNLSIFIPNPDFDEDNSKKHSIFMDLIQQLIWTQYELAVNMWGYLPNCFLMSGGMTQGYGFMNDFLVAGPAHLRAYEIANETVFPRIELDRIIINEYSEYLKGNELLIKDEKGCTFLNYLIISQQYPHSEKDELERFSKFIEENLDLKKSEVNVYLKYLWTAAYFNYYIVTIQPS
jgi:hypothetical protein